MSILCANTCPFCVPTAEEVLWQSRQCRVILVNDHDYPGFCRVIWREHIKEMTDLVASDQQYLMQVVMAVEAALRALLQPEKINLASLGNQVPHLHWHIIPRFADDPHFPDPIWSGARRVGAKKEIDPGLIKVALVTNLKKQVK